MKFKIKKTVLLDALNNVSKAISNKNIIPILSGIKFELSSDKLVLTASDNDITIQTTILKSDDLIIDATGSIVIKGKYILDIVRKLDDKMVDIEIVDDHKIIVYTKNSRFNLNGIDVNEYPEVKFQFGEEYIDMKSGDFRSMISQTNYACSLDEARVVLTGVNIKVIDKSYECSATDSYRLALRKMELSKGLKENADIIVPSRNLNELLKVIPSDDIDMQLYLYSNKIVFRFDNIIFQSRLINGTYPNTKNLIPSDKLFDLVLNKNDFYNMVDRASILNDDKDNNVITMEIKDKLLKITSMSLEIGKVEEKMVINCDDSIKISFSGKYMMDALRTIKTENVVISFVGEVKPILLREENNDNLVCLILPIRTY